MSALKNRHFNIYWMPSDEKIKNLERLIIWTKYEGKYYKATLYYKDIKSAQNKTELKKCTYNRTIRQLPNYMFTYILNKVWQWKKDVELYYKIQGGKRC